MNKLIALLRVEMEDQDAIRADLKGVPIYLGLAMNGAKKLKMKPQNILMNLPLAPVG